MAKVLILARELPLGAPTQRAASDWVTVTYSLEFQPPYTVSMPLAGYRDATDAELISNPRLKFYPHGQAQQDAELRAIRQDIDKAATSAPPTFDLP